MLHWSVFLAGLASLSIFFEILQVPDERLLPIILPNLFWLHYVTVKSYLECCWNRPLNVCSSVVRLGNLKRRSQLCHCVSLNIGPSRYLVYFYFIKLGESSLGLFFSMAAALHLLPDTQRWLVSLLVRREKNNTCSRTTLRTGAIEIHLTWSCGQTHDLSIILIGQLLA